MANFPETLDVWVDKTGADFVASTDPNTLGDIVEATEGLIGALGKPQSWSATLVTLLRKYKSGMLPIISSDVPVVKAGECVLENTDGTKWCFRRNPSDVTLGSANIDAGTLIATTYHIYATGATAATTTPLVYSTDAIAPSAAYIGTAPYRKIGYFINTAVGSLSATHAGSNTGGRVVGIYNYTASLLSTGSTVMPADDTIPQNNEGDEYMTLKITPTSTTNKLKIDVVCNGGSGSSGANFSVALFQDSTASALAAVYQGASGGQTGVFTHYMEAGTISETTFKVRAGCDAAGTFTFNGLSGSQVFGGVNSSSITITEIEN